MPFYSKEKIQVIRLLNGVRKNLNTEGHKEIRILRSKSPPGYKGWESFEGRLLSIEKIRMP